MNNKEIGERIKELRIEKKFTQKELAERLYVTDKAVSKWERGNGLPEVGILNELAKILEVNIEYLLEGKVEIEGEDQTLSEKELVQEDNIVEEKRINTKLIVSGLLGLLLFILVIFNFLYDKNKKDELKENYIPEKIVEGENRYELYDYELEKDGLSLIKETIDKLEFELYTIEYMKIDLNYNGCVKSFRIVVNKYDHSENYWGEYSLDYKDKKLIYTDMKMTGIINYYTKNSNIDYLDILVRKIPLTGQIKEFNSSTNSISYRSNDVRMSESKYIDGRNGKIEVIKKEDYQKDSSSFGLSDAEFLELELHSRDETKLFSYVFDVVDKDSMFSFSGTMEYDYSVNDGEIKFTRDYGRNWIKADITKEELEETFNYYRTNGTLLLESWYIGKEENPIAFFYGEEATLKISNSNGLYWDTQYFGKKDLRFTRRVVGFTEDGIGYIGLGTDWSMGTGELKKLYLSKDEGRTWNEIKVPVVGSRSTLMDFMMYNENIGILVLTNTDNINYPLVYATNDAGEHWDEVKIYPNLNVSFYTDIDKIEYNKVNKTYTIQMGQGDESVTKMIFTVEDNIKNPWTYEKKIYENIHTVG